MMALETMLYICDEFSPTMPGGPCNLEEQEIPR